jgi:hypothetical protein
MKKANPIFDKEIGRRIEAIFNLIAHAYDELTERKILVKRSAMNEFAEFIGIYVQPANAKWEFFIGFFPSYYATTGIPLCFGIDAYYDENLSKKLHQILKEIIAKEPSLYEYRNLDSIPTCGIKSDKIEALSKNSTLADYLLLLTEKAGFSLKLTD